MATTGLTLLMLASSGIVDAQKTEYKSNQNVVNDYEGYNSFAYGQSPNQTYKSFPLAAPLFQVSTWDKSAVDPASHFFMSTLSAVADSPPSTYIFQSSDLSLVYASPAEGDNVFGGTTANVRPQTLNGQTYLTYWRGPNNGGTSSRGCGFYNEQYELVYDLNPVGLAPGIVLDIHECQVTQDNTVLLSIYAARSIDATPVGGPANGTIIDSLFQEIDPVTNEVLFTWAAYDHFNISDSFVPYAVTTTGGATGWDWTHLNSIEKTADGSYLVSMRHTHTISLHDNSTGASIWIMGGKRNQFADLSGGRATSFAWQHDARFRAADLSKMSLFDNQGDEGTIGCKGANCSRGLLLDLDLTPGSLKASVKQEFLHPVGLISDAMGSYGVQANGNVLLGWGLNPAFTEHDGASGDCVLDVQFGPWPTEDNDAANANYRIYKDDWTAFPAWPPAAVVEDGTLYVSWNGATEVRSWAVYTGAVNATDEFVLHATLVKNGFETSIALKDVLGQYVQIRGLDSEGKVLPSGSSNVVKI